MSPVTKSEAVNIRNLYDVPGFAGLRKVTSAFGIELTVHGGFIRRLITMLRKSDSSIPHPEELAFFSSDVDVVHSGKSSQTPEISDALIEAIPFGESIRWQIKSAEEFSIFDAATPLNGIVPANLMSLNTRETWGIKDEWHGQQDIRQRLYRYIRNGFYKKSPLFQAGRDLEIFSALLYFKILVDEMIFAKELENQPGLDDAKTVLHSACSSSSMLAALQESAYLRARLLYLMKDIRALALDGFNWKIQMTAFGIDRLVEYLSKDEMFGLGKQLAELVGNDQPVTISARLGGDQYRLKGSTEAWQVGEEAANQFEVSAAKLSRDIAVPVLPKLGDGQKVIFSSPPLRINQGKSESSRVGRTIHEFLHFTIPLEGDAARQLAQSPDSAFAVLLGMTSSSEEYKRGTPVLLSVPSVCSVVANGQNGMLYVRINALGFLERSMALTKTPSEDDVNVRIFVLERMSQDLKLSGSENILDNQASTFPPQAPGQEVSTPPSNLPIEALPSNSMPVPQVPCPKSGTIIFVHGILSNCSACFSTMHGSFERDPRFHQFLFRPFDYDYEDDMGTSSRHLVDFIRSTPPGSPVTLICHSMGGLVGRLAILTGEVSQVKRLIMLGTPNFGAIRTAQLGLLSQIAMRLLGKIYAVFRKQGIRDLTRVTEIFSAPIQTGRQFADGIEYVTIPGEFFNESRPFWDRGEEDHRNASVTGFATLNLVTELLMAAPLWRVALKQPHDGIVEAVSNSLIPCAAGRKSEKCESINDPARFGKTYLHLTHERCSDLTHVMIQQDPTIIEIVKNLSLADTIVDWFKNLDSETSRRLKASFG
jgi:pimeloyl-ACP methyl ester carboxylesterase